MHDKCREDMYMRSEYYEVEKVRAAIHANPVPSISPAFLDNGDLNWKAIRKNVDFLIENGAKTLLITKGDSLFDSLTDKEIAEMTKVVVETCNKRAMVISCADTWPLQETLDFAAYCRDIGADLFIPFMPDWCRSSGNDNIVKFIEETAKVMPVMLLSCMIGGGVPLPVLKALKPDCGVVAMKDDVPSPYGRRALAVIRDKFAFLSGGQAQNFLDVAHYGADGYLAVFNRAFPEVDKKFWNAYLADDYKTCVYVIEYYEQAFFTFCAEKGLHWNAAIHGMMEFAGLEGRNLRFPYDPLTDEQMELLRGFLQEKGLL